MPRRPGVPSDERFLRANLNDPDNQAALLRAYLELKKTAEELSQKLAQASQELSAREATRAEAARQARDAGQQQLENTSARLDRLGEVMRLVRWAAEWAAKGGGFLVGTRHDLGQVIALATANADTCEQVRYDKSHDRWLIAWGDGRPDTLLVVTPPKGGEPAPAPARRRLTSH